MENNWRNVPGFEGKYQISIDTKEGKCRSINPKTGKVFILKNTADKRDGRIYWKFYSELTGESQQAARWIALTYPELVQNEYFEGAEIDHIDTDPTNNHPSNLRWVTRKENMNNPLTLIHNSEAQKGKLASEETRKKMSASHTGKKHREESKKKMSLGKMNHPSLSHKVEQYTNKNVFVARYDSISEASRQTKIHKGDISACCLGKRKTAGKCRNKDTGEVIRFIWKYVS